jgi:hypothetical protein
MLTEGDQNVAKLSAGQHGVFTYADALAAGLSRRQLARRVHEWERVHDGVYRMPGVVPSWRGDLLAACLAATYPAAISHRSGAALRGLPGGRDDIVEITTRRWLRTQKSGLVVHESTRFDERDITVLDGIPVVTTERLILELAGIWRSVNFVETVIQAARRKRLITYASTRATFDRLARRGVKGVAVMRAALERWNPQNAPTESDMETMLIQILREHGLPEPVTLFVVRDEHGNFVARTDAALPLWRITIEYQSKQEHTDEFQLEKDDHRRNSVIAAGWKPLAARYSDLRNGGHALVRDIRALMRE